MVRLVRRIAYAIAAAGLGLAAAHAAANGVGASTSQVRSEIEAPLVDAADALSE